VRAFVTGLTGFVGPHLAKMLLGKGCEVVGLGFRIDKPVAGQDLPANVSVAGTDIRDFAGLRKILEETRPDHIYHLAAISNVATSFKEPRLTYDVNVGGTLNLFEALRELELKPRIVHVSTAHVYRSIQTETGLDEKSPVHLLTPYAASKFMCETLATQYVEGFGFQTMTVRPFNHVGPGQLTGFVCSDFAKQIAAIKLGKAEPVLRVGNLAAVRDFTDVRDVVEAYWTVATEGIPGETYNVGSGSPRSMQQMVEMLCDQAGVRVRIEVDPEKFRPIETLRLFGNSAKLQALGWKPEIEFQKTLQDILDYWLKAQI
jgi:GDP-4-dehydro-6-deoxy-D-mannose reductase